MERKGLSRVRLPGIQSQASVSVPYHYHFYDHIDQHNQHNLHSDHYHQHNLHHNFDDHYHYIFNDVDFINHVFNCNRYKYHLQY
mmetsp:Transcript_71656/g.149797  ORF Transcript_71656/g.149797 Transcript_71656/m.149797 type:complete len:84 (-) Transcript_71656:1501-1752(-)